MHVRPSIKESWQKKLAYKMITNNCCPYINRKLLLEMGFGYGIFFLRRVVLEICPFFGHRYTFFFRKSDTNFVLTFIFMAYLLKFFRMSQCLCSLAVGVARHYPLINYFPFLVSFPQTITIPHIRLSPFLYAPQLFLIAQHRARQKNDITKLISCRERRWGSFT